MFLDFILLFYKAQTILRFTSEVSLSFLDIQLLFMLQYR